MSEEFSRVSELRAALGTDLGVLLLASITWKKRRKRGWRGRSGYTEALINWEPRHCWLGEGRGARQQARQEARAPS